MNIDEATKERVKAATDLVELVESYGVVLRKDGASLKGICPFHSEKSGSLDVNPAKQLFKCYGCHAAGDSIRWVQLKENMSFQEAVRKLAERKSIHIPESSDGRQKAAPAKKKAQPKPEPAARPEPMPPAQPFDWKPCVKAFTPAQAEKLAEWRGLSPDFVRWLHESELIGIHGGNIAIAVHDDNGAVVRCHKRRADGSWIYSPSGGSTAPLVLGNPSEAGYTLVFESQWDAFAVLDRLGFHEDPSGYAAIITRGATSNTDLTAFRAPVFTLIPQNDPEHKRSEKTGLRPDEEWLEKVRSSLPKSARYVVGRVPEGHKDANDWIKDANPTAELIRKRLIEFAKHPLMAKAWSFADLLGFMNRNKDDPNSLIGFKKRFLGKGYSFMFIGPSGIGKSTIVASMVIHWAVGSTWHGIEVRRPLKIVVIQAENDEGDIAEMIEGQVRSIQIMSEAEKINLQKNIFYFRINDKTGDAFCSQLEEIVVASGADLVIADPLLAYLGGDAAKQEVVSKFLREGIQPILERTGVILGFVHHTGKTSSDAHARKGWAKSDFAYLGNGSSELTNWPRAIFTILPVPDEERMFKLMIPKRGSRAGMLSFDHEITDTIFLRHGNPSEGQVWVKVPEPKKDESEEDKEARREASKILDVTGYLKFLPKHCPIEEAAQTLKIRGFMDHRGAHKVLKELESRGYVQLDKQHKMFYKEEKRE